MKTTSFIPFIFVLSPGDFGRLKTEINIGEGDQSETAVNGQKIVYTYGSSGDIIKREYYDVQASLGSIFTRQTVVRTDSFGYTNSNWKNQCDSTNINGVSSALSYDAIGNPLTYRDGMQMTWQNGRQLKKLTAPNGKMLRFSYDINGQRQAKIERSYGNVVHTTKYFYDGTKLAGEKKDDTIVWYDYDENGAPVGMRVNGLDYIFRKNLQGDITGIYNSSDELIVEYSYADAWGAGVTVSGSAASTIGMYNSFRYRGYYYDTESGLYYLNSRYYDPVACRFINADGYVSTGQGISGHNMYSYGVNNPVMLVDPSGSKCHIFDGGRSGPECPTTASGYCNICHAQECCLLSGSNQQSTPIWMHFEDNDGSFSLYNSERINPNRTFQEKAFTVSSSSPSFSPKDGQISAGSLDFMLASGAWNFDNVNLALLNMGSLSLSAGFDSTGGGVSAMASVWSPSVSFVLWDKSITLSFNVGSIGIKAKATETEGITAGISGGFGFTINVK